MLAFLSSLPYFIFLFLQSFAELGYNNIEDQNLTTNFKNLSNYRVLGKNTVET